ncbi:MULTISPECIES: hypothetical protein [unclassified Rhizobium]|uniref:hypothetical protein n=1 Tax=unclassified Rhizobium TaxID=2613769 RepID=UPI001ADC007F|nr:MULTISPECIES: hypothetical protein [unclassified Rhizobium]MBO9125497.1 hypothetical protein [Rhizobium sp. 16-488-2b]MBO9176082.1 hypothetical protein [Rhizobium sp. 16-488-2a]
MTKLTYQQKLDALSYRFYQAGPWAPKAGDFYTTSRADLELYQVVSVENGLVRTRYTEGTDAISEWPEAGFLTEGFGARRVFVPDWVICAPPAPTHSLVGSEPVGYGCFDRGVLFATFFAKASAEEEAKMHQDTEVHPVYRHPAPAELSVGSEPVVSVKTMRLGDGRADYFVSIKVGKREVTPHVFREEYKAAYHVALYSWLLNGTNKPDLMAFDEGDWPAQATETLADVEAEIASVVQSVNEWDDRTSPDDYPEHLLITSEELTLILRNFAAAISSMEVANG